MLALRSLSPLSFRSLRYLACLKVLTVGNTRFGKVSIPSCIACDRPLLEKVPNYYTSTYHTHLSENIPTGLTVTDRLLINDDDI